MVDSFDASLAIANLDLSLEPLPPDTRQSLLRFTLGQQDSALLPLEQIAEVLRIEGSDILPVPDLPNSILGIYNWRGEMLWLVDLNVLLGYPPLRWLPDSPTALAMVIQTDDRLLGLVVPQVHEIELHELQQLQPAIATLFPPSLLPFVLGVLPKSCDPVLNGAALLQHSLWQKDARS